MSNQWRIWNTVSGNKISVAVTAVELTKADKKVKIDKGNEVEREIVTCLSKRFSLTNDNSSMKDDFTSKIGYLGDIEGT